MIRLVAALTSAVLVLGAAAAGPPYRTGAPPGHTGGFGEGHCGACHFGATAGDSATVTLDTPARYRPGQRYEITVTVRHPELMAAGFQLAVRFAGGAREGGQAGCLQPMDSRTQVAPGADGVIYAGHTEDGAVPAEPGVGRWTVHWTAPEHDGDAVVFHVAANAANDDDSEFGDRIVMVHRRVDPGG